jgi:hypothetical protein
MQDKDPATPCGSGIGECGVSWVDVTNLSDAQYEASSG